MSETNNKSEVKNTERLSKHHIILIVVYYFHISF